MVFFKFLSSELEVRLGHHSPDSNSLRLQHNANSSIRSRSVSLTHRRKMSAVGSLVFCSDCGNLLDSTSGNEKLVCEQCGGVTRGRAALNSTWGRTLIMMYYFFRYHNKGSYYQISAVSIPLCVATKAISCPDAVE